jgi:hypothetical protein
MSPLRIVALAFFACFAAARAGETQPPEFTLKLENRSTDPLVHVMQWPFRSTSFYLVVKDGQAFLSQTEVPPREVDKWAGKLDIILRTGIDPATRQFKDRILRIAFHHSGPGWAADRFITDLVVPFSLPRKDGDPAVFSDTATMTLTWEIASKGSIRTIGDPMNVRFEQTLSCTTVKLNFSPKLRP